MYEVIDTKKKQTYYFWLTDVNFIRADPMNDRIVIGFRPTSMFPLEIPYDRKVLQDLLEALHNERA